MFAKWPSRDSLMMMKPKKRTMKMASEAKRIETALVDSVTFLATSRPPTITKINAPMIPVVKLLWTPTASRRELKVVPPIAG